MALSTRKSLAAPAVVSLGTKIRLWWQREQTLGYALITPALFVLLLLVAYPLWRQALWPPWGGPGCSTRSTA